MISPRTPPLPEIDILSLLLGDVRDPQSGELRALRAPDLTEQQLIQTGAARLLTSPLSSGVGRVVEQSFGVDTFGSRRRSAIRLRSSRQSSTPRRCS